jgi:hypothetical protein
MREERNRELRRITEERNAVEKEHEKWQNLFSQLTQTTKINEITKLLEHK